jgi:hypothetical protein
MENKKLNLQELEKVAGGTIYESVSDGTELYRRGLLDKDINNTKTIRDKMHSLGYTGYIAMDGFKNNIYKDKQGNIVTRQQFWKNFDAENGTQIIRSSKVKNVTYRLGL